MITEGEGAGVKGIVIEIKGDTAKVVNLFRGTFYKPLKSLLPEGS